MPLCHFATLPIVLFTKCRSIVGFYKAYKIDFIEKVQLAKWQSGKGGKGVGNFGLTSLFKGSVQIYPVFNIYLNNLIVAKQIIRS